MTLDGAAFRDRPPPRVGDITTDPVHGETVRWLQIGSDNVLTRAELTVHPQASGPPAHIHPKSHERFEVHSGSIRLKSGRVERVVEAGETAAIAPRTTHTWFNHTDEPAVVIVEMDPGYRFAQFIDQWYELARAGRLNSRGDLGLLDTTALFDATVLDTLALPGVPVALQKALFRGFGPLARRRTQR